MNITIEKSKTKSNGREKTRPQSEAREMCVCPGGGKKSLCPRSKETGFPTKKRGLARDSQMKKILRKGAKEEKGGSVLSDYSVVSGELGSQGGRVDHLEEKSR